MRDKEIVDLELQIRDLESVEKKIQKTDKIARGGDKDAKKCVDVLQVYKSHLESFQPARTAPVYEEEKKYISDLFLLSEKPVLFVCNVDDGSAINGNGYSQRFAESVKAAITSVMTNHHSLLWMVRRISCRWNRACGGDNDSRETGS